MGDARFDRMHGQTRASDDGKAALDAGDAFDPGVAGAQITIGALQSVARELADIGRDRRRQLDLCRFEARKVERSERFGELAFAGDRQGEIAQAARQRDIGDAFQPQETSRLGVPPVGQGGDLSEVDGQDLFLERFFNGALGGAGEFGDFAGREICRGVRHDWKPVPSRGLFIPQILALQERDAKLRALEPRGLGEIDPKAVAFPLVAAGHFGAGVAEVLLHMRLLDLRRGGEAGAQRMAAEGAFALALGEIAANPRRQRAFLDEAGDMLVGEPLGGDAAVLARDRPEQRPVADPPEPHPGLEQRDGAGVGAGAAADLDLAPAGLAGDLQQHAAVVVRILAGRKISIQPVPSSVWPGPQSRPTISERRSAPAKPSARMARSRRPRRSISSVASMASSSSAKIAAFCTGGRRVLAADAGEHGGDVAVAGVERLPELAVAPADPGEAPLERRDADAGLGLRREIEPDGLRLGRQFVKTVAAQPGGELPPVGVIGARGVFAAGGAGVVFGGLGQPGEARIEAERAGESAPSASRRQLAVRGLGASVPSSFTKFRRLGEGSRGSFGSISSGMVGLPNRVR